MISPTGPNGNSRRRQPQMMFAAIGVVVSIATSVIATMRAGGGSGSLAPLIIGLAAVVVVALAVVAMRARGDAGDEEAADDDADAPDERKKYLLVVVALVILGLAAALTFMSAPAAAQGAARPVVADRGALVLVRAGDTIVVDRFVRTPTTLVGSSRVKGGARIDYYFAIAPGEVVQNVVLSFWGPGAAEDSKPLQRASMTMHGDTVDVFTGAGTQHIPSKFGAVPSIGNMLVVGELFTRRARSLGGSGEFPLFAVQNGATLQVAVKAIGGDSVVMTIGPQPQRLAIDAVGRIVGGSIPSQKVEYVRLGASAADGLDLTPPADVTPPKADYSAPPGAPYTAEEVVVTGPGGIKLGGTLTKPRGAGPFPAVVTITGSGAQDRDEFIPYAGGIRLFRAVADTLGRRGIAVLRLDDRGVGASTGDFANSTSADFADDTRAAIAFLRARKDIDGARIAVIGHSEGGMVGPMVAASDAKLRALIVLAGPASKGIDISKAQNKQVIDADPKLSAAQKDSEYAALVKQIDNTTPTNPWIKFWWAYDPAVTARKVTAPTLIVQGGTDHQVAPAEAERLGQLIREGGNRDVTVRVIPNVNHLFVDDADGDFQKYAALKSNAINAAALGAIADWAVKALARGTPTP